MDAFINSHSVSISWNASCASEVFYKQSSGTTEDGKLLALKRMWLGQACSDSLGLHVLIYNKKG